MSLSVSQPAPARPPDRTLSQVWEDAILTFFFALFGLACLATLPFALSETLKLAILGGFLPMAAFLNVYALIKAPWGWPANRRPYAGGWHTAIRLSSNVAFTAFLLVNHTALEQLYAMRGEIGRMMLGLDFA